MKSDTTIIKDVSTFIYFTNDVKLAASLITAGLSVVQVKSRTNPKNNKTEILFGFEENQTQSTTAMAYLSGNLVVDAKTILDNRDSLLRFVSNGSREILDRLNNG